MGLFNDVEDDLTAINNYFNRTVAKTQAAARLKTQWSSWYNGLSWLDKQSEATVQQATNRRNAFNVANTQGPGTKEYEQVQRVVSTGMDRETAKNKPRITDSAGNYSNQKGITVASSAKGTVPSGARPTIRQGSQGDAVRAWQKIIGVTQDGKFGPNTASVTKSWQKQHGLVADGVVGTASWTAALGSGSSMDFALASITPVAPANVPATKVPTGVVATIGSVTRMPQSKPKTSVPSAVKKAAAKPAQQVEKAPSNVAAQTPGLVAGMPSLENVPLWAKITGGIITVLGALGLVGVGVAAIHSEKKR